MSQGLVVRYSQFRKSCEGQDERGHGACAVEWEQVEAIRRQIGRRPCALRFHGRPANIKCRADCAGEVGVWPKEGAGVDRDSGGDVEAAESTRACPLGKAGCFDEGSTYCRIHTCRYMWHDTACLFTSTFFNYTMCMKPRV